MKLPLNRIRLDGGTQLRERLDPAIIAEYRPYFAGPDVPLPPPVVFHDPATGDHWLADGFHRYHAAAQELPTEGEIEVELHTGTQRDAQLYAAAANERHGLRRTTADRKRAAALLLRDAEWSKWSDREIARRILVDPHLVAGVRRELVASEEIPQLESRQGRDGKVRKLPAKRDKELTGGPGASQAADAGARDVHRGAGAVDGGGCEGSGGADGQGADAGPALPGGDVHRGEGGAPGESDPGPVERDAELGAQVDRVEAAPAPWLHDPPAATQTVIDAERDGYRRGKEEAEAAAKAAYAQGQQELLEAIGGSWLGLSDLPPDAGDLRYVIEERIAELRMDAAPRSCATCDLREAELQQALCRLGMPWRLLMTQVQRLRGEQAGEVSAVSCPARTDEPPGRAACDSHATPRCSSCGEALVPNRMCPAQPLSVCAAGDRLLDAAKALGTRHAGERRRPWAGKGDEMSKLMTTLGAPSESVSRRAEVYATYKEAFDQRKAAKGGKK